MKKYLLLIIILQFFSKNVESNIGCNVNQYNAYGSDNIDDTAQIQNAINSCNVVYFPTGTYLVSGTISVPSNRTLIGEIGSIIKAVDDNSISNSIFKNENWLSGNDNWISIIGIEINGNKGNQIGEHDYKGIWFNNVDNFKIQRCIVYNCYGYGDPVSGTGSAIFVQNATQGDISNNSVYDNGGNGILVYYGSSFIIVANNLVINNSQIGIESEGRNGSNYADYRNSNINIIGNICRSNKDHNILVDWTDNTNIANNVCTGSLHNGIELLGSHEISVTNNIVHSNGDNNSWADIKVTAQEYGENGRNQNITITGNTLGVSLYNSLIIDTTYNILVNGNIMLSQYKGVVINTASAALNITSNRIAARYEGIKIGSSIDTIIINNNFLETNTVDGNGILCVPDSIIIDRVEISNNTFINNFNGIYCFPNVEFKNGHLTNNTFRNSNNKDLCGDPGGVILSSIFVEGNSFEKGVENWHLGTLPMTGTWKQADKMYKLLPIAGSSPGWICVNGGTPGTWKAMSNLAN